MRSILGNFGFINKTVKDIEEEIKEAVEEYFLFIFLELEIAFH